jgi:hypothetical protein
MEWGSSTDSCALLYIYAVICATRRHQMGRLQHACAVPTILGVVAERADVLPSLGVLVARLADAEGAHHLVVLVLQQVAAGRQQGAPQGGAQR